MRVGGRVAGGGVGGRVRKDNLTGDPLHAEQEAQAQEEDDEDEEEEEEEIEGQAQEGVGGAV